MKKLTVMLLSLCVLFAGLTGCAKSQKNAEKTDAAKAWKPSKTITIDVAFAPGGDTDYNA